MAMLAEVRGAVVGVKGLPLDDIVDGEGEAALRTHADIPPLFIFFCTLVRLGGCVRSSDSTNGGGGGGGLNICGTDMAFSLRTSNITPLPPFSSCFSSAVSPSPVSVVVSSSFASPLFLFIPNDRLSPTRTAANLPVSSLAGRVKAAALSPSPGVSKYMDGNLTGGLCSFCIGDVVVEWGLEGVDRGCGAEDA